MSQSVNAITFVLRAPRGSFAETPRRCGGTSRPPHVCSGESSMNGAERSAARGSRGQRPCVEGTKTSEKELQRTIK
ncbi:unnamed protein product [Prunus armeniaca]|uniref:Uncharacterized protein n=1 Tax=Prunus armeniaca TaxID=36596 RepID=A0A6J5UUP3_PRUAR|nr:unnamed protein product [Prunus armeniaca]CAB4309800.1 unnamed protein product [Prunus armeniaca]